MQSPWLSFPVRSSVPQKMGDRRLGRAWNRNAFTRGPVVHKFWSGTAVVGAGSSSIAASSINMYMTDANDTVLYQSRGGIELLQGIKVTTSYSYNQTNSDSTWWTWRKASCFTTCPARSRPCTRRCATWS